MKIEMPKGLEKKIQDVVVQKLKIAGFAAMRRIMERTPVVTGQLRAGWRLSQDEKGSVKIWNSVPYARDVEKRHGMIRKTIPELRQYFKVTL